LKIRVLRRGFDDYSTEIFHICRLFYEGVQLVYEPEGEAELELGLELDEPGAGEIRFRAALSDLSSGQLWSKEHTRRIGDEPEIQRKRAVKRGLGYALLQTLKEATGLEQPWGILTGVRPTKLLHNMMREHDLETCKQILRDEYLITEPKIELLTDIAVRHCFILTARSASISVSRSARPSALTARSRRTTFAETTARSARFWKGCTRKSARWAPG